MAESAAAPLALAETLGWVGFDLDEAGGSRVGRVHSVFVDADGGEPTWLIAMLGRRRQRKTVAIPVQECAGGAGRVWTAQPGGALAAAHVVDPVRPLLREHELTICAHYGVGEQMGRAAQVAGRSGGSVTSRPA